MRKLLINLLEIDARVAYSGLLKEFEEDKKVSKMIEFAKKELAGRRIKLLQLDAMQDYSANFSIQC